jgi:diguanylate cyclase (GGDEF)-like protein/PAS domain S-box-containing protein
MNPAAPVDWYAMSAVVEHSSVERQMLDAIGESVMATDADGRVTYTNQAAADAFRASTDELIGRSVHDLLTPTASRRELQEIGEAILEGRSWTGVLTGQRLDGTTFPHRVTLAPRYDENGLIVGTVGVGRDITPEVAASAKARASDERFRRVFDESPVAMGLVGLDLRVQRCNAAMERLLGYTSTEMAGKTLDALTHPDDVEEDLEAARHLIENADVVSHQIQKRFIRKDGSIVVGRVTGTLIRDDDGEPMYGIGTVEDLTATLGAFTSIQEQKERLAQTLEAAGVATWDLDLLTMRQTVSDNYADVLGIPFDQVPDTFEQIIEMVHPDDRHLFLEPNPEEGAADRFDVEFRMVLPGGAVAWMGCKGSFIRGEADDVVAIRGTMVNLTAQRHVEIRRVEAEQRYREVLEAAHDGFIGADENALVVEWNAAAERMFGWRAEEIIGRPIADTLIPEDKREVYREAQVLMRGLLAAGQPLPERFELLGLHRDGTVFPIELSVVAGVDAVDRGLIRAFVRDITDRKAREAQLAEQAVTDALTGLPDRSVLMAHLGEGLERLADRHGAVGVLFIDVDRFKAVNDELGHEAGDQVLVSVAQRLRSAVRPADTVVRLGGDEFAVVCTDLGGMEDARLVADRILAALQAPLPLGTMEHQVCVSIGIAVSLDPSDEPEAIVRHADEAMYRAKKAGGRRSSD